MSVTLITFENHKNYIGKPVEVVITSYYGGFIYPDNNTLVGMNEEYYYFLSDKGLETEEMWHWEAKEQKNEFGKIDLSIQVWDKEEYDEFYKKE